VSTISNTNLEELAPGDWTCERLDTLEATARTVYYVTRVLRYLEALP
jgi:hypothetical protein